MAASEVWDRAHRGLTIGLLATVAFTAFEALAVATALPTTVDEIGGLALYGWTFSAFMLASLVGITAGGTLADSHGPAVPFLAGAAVFIVGLIGAGASSTMPLLVAARFVQGLGSGAIGSVSYVAVGRGYSPEAKPHMIALLSSAWVVPGLIGPAAAGLVTDVFGWRWVFFGLAPATAVGASIAVPAMRRMRADADANAISSDGRRRTASAALLALGAALLMAGIESPEPIAGAALALVGLLLGIPTARQLLPPGTLRARTGLGAAVALIGLTGFAFFGAEAFVPLAIGTVRDQPATIAGLPLTLGTITWTAGAWIQAKEAQRRSRRVLVALGLALIGVGVAGTSAILVPNVPFWTAGPTWALTSLGMGITYSTLALVILECASEGEEGRASAALQLSYTLCIALGTGVGGTIVSLSERMGQSLSLGITGVNASMVVVTLVGIGLTVRLPRDREEASRVAAG